MKAIDIMMTYVPGSQDQPWSWTEEYEDLCRRVCACCEQRGHYQEQIENLMRDALSDTGDGWFGDPVILGGDRRVWDGHHRLLAMVRLQAAYNDVPIVHEIFVLPSVKAERGRPQYSFQEVEYPPNQPSWD